MTTINYSDWYYTAYDPYEDDNFELFKKAVDGMKSEHKLLYMLLLETCMYEIQSSRCCEYLINLLAQKLSSEELVLCTMSNNAMIREILEKRGLDLGNMNKLISRLEESDRKKFDDLFNSIRDSMFNFGGTDEQFKMIDTWLDNIKTMMLNIGVVNLC